VVVWQHGKDTLKALREMVTIYSHSFVFSTKSLGCIISD
jgi:hypothetical protein